MKIIQVRVLCGVLLVIVPLLLLAACGGGGGGDGDGSSAVSGSSGETGIVSVSLTDAQNAYNAVVLTIKEVGIVANNTATTYYNSGGLGNLPLTVNILDFPGEATLPLADIEVDLPENGNPICFDQIRLVLEANNKEYKNGGVCTDDVPCNNYVVESGDPTAYALKTPSGQQSGVKILTPSGLCDETDDPNDVCVGTPNAFCIEEGDDTVYVSIDFDPMTAIIHTGNENNDKHKYILKPTGIRIIEGDWFAAPDSFIDGLVAVPIYNSVSGCEEFATPPLVTIAAYYNSATITDPPEVQTVALAEGPVSGADVCLEWCAEDSDQDCETTCEVDLLSECYYSGKFKLLLREKETYDLAATWKGFTDEMSEVEYNSTVFFELVEE